MLRSLLIKAPTLLGAVAAVWLVKGAAGWALAAAIVAIGAAVLSYFVFHPNAGLWAPIVWRGDASDAVALTFDDGPDPRFSPRVLDVLAAKNVPAAFFVVGDRVRRDPKLAARIVREGHVVGNHSDSHDLGFHFRLWKGSRAEIDRCSAAIREATGVEPAFFRSPQGFKNPALGDVLRERGLVAIGWQARAFDAAGKSAAQIAERILSRARPGGVILLHDGGGLLGTEDRTPTIEALPIVIDGLRARGLRIVRLDELLGTAAHRASASS